MWEPGGLGGHVPLWTPAQGSPSSGAEFTSPGGILFSRLVDAGVREE